MCEPSRSRPLPELGLYVSTGSFELDGLSWLDAVA
jgi:hypothetical protein